MNQIFHGHDDDDDLGGFDDGLYGGDDGLVDIPLHNLPGADYGVGNKLVNNAPSSSNNNTNKTLDASSALAIRRSRLLTLVPQCAEIIEKYSSWGMSLEEAWTLYEQGGEEEKKLKAVAVPPKNISASAKPNNAMVLFDSQTDLDLALELSKEIASAQKPPKNNSTPKPPVVDYDQLDPQTALELAIELSKAEHTDYDSDATEDFKEVTKEVLILSKQDAENANKKRKREVILLESQDTIVMPTKSNAKPNKSTTPKSNRWTVVDLSEGEDNSGYRTPTSNSSWSIAPSPVERSAVKGKSALPSSSSSMASNAKKLSAIPEDKLVDLCEDDYWLDSGPTKAKNTNTSTSIGLFQLDKVDYPVRKKARRNSSVASRDDEIDLTNSDPYAFEDNDFVQDSGSKHHSTPSNQIKSNTSIDSVYNRMRDAKARSRQSILQTLPPSHEVSRVMENYVITEVSVDASLMLYVDTRERKKNNTYRDFFKSIEGYVSSRTSAGSAEVSLTVGDFLLAFTDSTDEHQWVANMAIERKCINDIVSRSAEAGEGPHFRQERNLRFSGLKYSCFLIEGDINQTNRTKPLTSQGYEQQNLQRLDVIQDSADLLAYICGIVCRNFGKYRVKVLHTIVAMETSNLLAALTVVAADELERIHANNSKSLKLPTLSSFQKYWHGKPRNSRQEKFTNDLDGIGIGSDTVHRIERRFGDADGLLSAYDLCPSKISKQLLLSDITLSACNICEEAQEKDECVGRAELQKDSLQVAQHVLMESNNGYDLFISNDSPRIEREVNMVLSQSMFDYMDQMTGFPSNVKSTVVSESEVSHGSYPWCELSIIGGLGALQDIMPGTKRYSAPIYFVSIPGFDVIEALAKAFDEIFINQESCKGKDFELKLARLAWDKVKNKMAFMLKNKFHNAVTEKRYPQMVVIIDNLGRGSGLIGACGRLKNVFAAKVHASDSFREEAVARSSSSSSSSSLNNDDESIHTVKLDKNRHPMSVAAARYLTSQLSWIVNLTVAIAQLELDYQILHSTVACPTKEIISMFLVEYPKQALLLFGEELST